MCDRASASWACIWPQSHLWNARLLPFLYLTRVPAGRHRRRRDRRAVVRRPARVRDAGDANETGVDVAPAAARLGHRAWASARASGRVSASRPRRIHFQRGLPFASFGVDNGKTGLRLAGLSGEEPSRRTSTTGPSGTTRATRARTPTASTTRIVNTMKQHRRGAAAAAGPSGRTTTTRTSYGTPMALMLLPFWTDGCIGSMEGLYFEASGTTPYHFLTAAAESEHSSEPGAPAALRGRRRRQGRASTCRRSASGTTWPSARRSSPRPTPTRTSRRIATSGPWTIYEVADSDLVVPARPTQPRAWPSGADALGEMRDRWLELGTSWFQHQDDWAAVPADAGPSDWQRITVEPRRAEDRRPAPGHGDAGRRRSRPSPLAAGDRHRRARRRDDSHLVHGRQGRRAGAGQDQLLPELEGRAAPRARTGWRPTSWSSSRPRTEVTLHLRHTSSVEYLGYFLTLLGIVVLFVLWRKGPVDVRARDRGPASSWPARRAAAGTDEPELDRPDRSPTRPTRPADGRPRPASTVLADRGRRRRSQGRPARRSLE